MANFDTKEVQELPRECLIELKGRWYADYINETEHRDVYMSELADIDSIVSDQRIFDEYKNTMFVPEDFCTTSENGWEA